MIDSILLYFIILGLVLGIVILYMMLHPKSVIKNLAQKRKVLFFIGKLLLVPLLLLYVVGYGFKVIDLYMAEDMVIAENYIPAMHIYKKYEEQDKYVETAYKYAMQLYNEEKYKDALDIFITLKDYKDSENMSKKISEKLSLELMNNTYLIACNWYEQGDFEKAYDFFNYILDYKDSQEKRDMASRFLNAHSITVGVRAAVAIIDNGNVKHANNEYNFSYSSWKDIVSVAFAEKCVIGLKIDGTVVTKGNFVEKAEKNWDDIIAVAAGVKHVVGLKSDGSVVADGINSHGQCDVGTWDDIVAVAAGWYHTVGLDKYGNVFIVGNNGEQQNEEMRQNKSEWTNIVAIAAGGGDKNNDGKGHTVGLRADGTVVAVGDNYYNQCEVNEWTNIVAIAAGEWHTVGLRADGTVVTTRPNQAIINNDESFGLACKVQDWTDIVEIAAGAGLTVGLKSDGTVLVAGYNKAGQRDAISAIGKVPPRQFWHDDFIK